MSQIKSITINNEIQKTPIIQTIGSNDADIIEKISLINGEIIRYNQQNTNISNNHCKLEEQLKNLSEVCKAMDETITDIKNKLSQYDIEEVETELEDHEIEEEGDEVEEETIKKVPTEEAKEEVNEEETPTEDNTASSSVEDAVMESLLPVVEEPKPKRKYNRRKKN